MNVYEPMTKSQVEDYRRAMLERTDNKTAQARIVFDTEPYYLTYERKMKDAGKVAR